MPPLEKKTREVLELFIQKAHRLRSLSFTKHMLEKGAKLQFSHKMGEDLQIRWDAPEDESVDAFVLTFRFFIQDNERSSLHELRKIAEDPALSDNWKAEYARVRMELNAQLDSPAGPMQIVWGDHAFTHREIMEVFVFGALAHANRAKQAQFEEWRKDSGFFPLFQYYFAHTLMYVLSAIAYLATLSEQEINPGPLAPGPTASSLPVS